MLEAGHETTVSSLSGRGAESHLKLLSQYLLHQRWVWNVQVPETPDQKVSVDAIARILGTLSRYGKGVGC